MTTHRSDESDAPFRCVHVPGADGGGGVVVLLVRHHFHLQFLIYFMPVIAVHYCSVTSPGACALVQPQLWCNALRARTAPGGRACRRACACNPSGPGCAKYSRSIVLSAAASTNINQSCVASSSRALDAATRTHARNLRVRMHFTAVLMPRGRNSAAATSGGILMNCIIRWRVCAIAANAHT